MTQECKELRNAAARLEVTVREMLAPASVTPSPQRMKLDRALEAVHTAAMRYDAARAQADREGC